jgi:hypothetical protein
MKTSSRKLKFRAKNKALGLCADCSKPVFQNGLLCKSCRDGHLKVSKLWQQNNPERTMLRSAKHRAKKKGIPCSIELADIKIPKYCPILGIELSTSIGGAVPNSPSLDKIISSLGYVKGNIQVISNKANYMKRDATLDELILIGEWAKKWKENN